MLHCKNKTTTSTNNTNHNENNSATAKLQFSFHFSHKSYNMPLVFTPMNIHESELDLINNE